MKYETTIQEIIPRTHDTTSFRFPRPKELQYQPGQYFFVTIKQDGKELTKHFSFSTSPTETGHIEFTKKLTDHEYSMALKTAKVGDCAKIDAPYGKFTFDGEYPKIGLLCGGIGITPFMSIIKNATDKKLDSKITLFYGCRTEEDIAFKTELENLAEKNGNLKLIIVLSQASSNWKGATGYINGEMVQKELPDFKDTVFFACGPPAMVAAMQGLVEKLGLPKEQLKLELFSGY
ncbi:MAG: FAD-dependent oxidoreductase [Candidatus Bathyarchaeia archaeon]|jgi:ferredoxin-NADP reductase